MNVDVVIAAETPAPRAAPRRDARQRHRGARPRDHATIAGPAPISIKPKHAEGLGAIGRAEGIAAWAVALARDEPTAP